MKTIIITPHLGTEWLDIQKLFIETHTPKPYIYKVYNVPKGIKHIRALGRCLDFVKKIAEKGDLIIEMDSDAFPFRKNWIEKIKEYLKDNEFVAVRRLENPYYFQRIAHPCFCAWYYGTNIVFKQVCDAPYIDNWQNRKWKKLIRTNKVNLHQQLYAIYGEFVYHHGCGSRLEAVKREKFFQDGLKYFNDIFEHPTKFILSLI